MSNPLVGGTSQANPFANVQQLMNQLQQFAQTVSGNPQQQVQQLLNSGKVSQERYNQAYQQAQEAQRQIQQFQKMFGGK